jgi:hypothetical protein
MEINKKPLTTEIVARLGDEPMVHSMIEDVIDGVEEYRDYALAEFMAGAVAILYGELTRQGKGFAPSEILDLAREELIYKESN